MARKTAEKHNFDEYPFIHALIRGSKYTYLLEEYRIIEGIKESALVIADLSYGNKNVHHEIGYAQGLNKKVLMLYKTRPGVEPKTEIGSNISMHDQLRYTNQTELRPKLLKKIRQFFGISNDEN